MGRLRIIFWCNATLIGGCPIIQTIRDGLQLNILYSALDAARARLYSGLWLLLRHILCTIRTQHTQLLCPQQQANCMRMCAKLLAQLTLTQLSSVTRVIVDRRCSRTLSEVHNSTHSALAR